MKNNLDFIQTMLDLNLSKEYIKSIKGEYNRNQSKNNKLNIQKLRKFYKTLNNADLLSYCTNKFSCIHKAVRDELRDRFTDKYFIIILIKLRNIIYFMANNKKQFKMEQLRKKYYSAVIQLSHVKLLRQRNKFSIEKLKRPVPQVLELKYEEHGMDQRKQLYIYMLNIAIAKILHAKAIHLQTNFGQFQQILFKIRKLIQIFIKNYQKSKNSLIILKILYKKMLFVHQIMKKYYKNYQMYQQHILQGMLKLDIVKDLIILHIIYYRIKDTQKRMHFGFYVIYLRPSCLLIIIIIYLVCLVMMKQQGCFYKKKNLIQWNILKIYLQKQACSQFNGQFVVLHFTINQQILYLTFCQLKAQQHKLNLLQYILVQWKIY